MRHAVLLRKARVASAPPLVCLHGMLGTPQSFDELAGMLGHPGAIWGSVLPGHGRPARTVPAGGFDAGLRALASDLAAPAFLLGYSLGARLALGLAALHPERVRGVIAVGAHLGFEVESEREARQRWDRAQAERLRAQGLPEFVTHWEALPLFETQRRLGASTLEHQRQRRLGHEAFRIADAFESLGTGSMPELGPRLGQSRVPVLLVAGALDPRFVAEAERAAAICPRADVRVVPEVGHNVVLEAPEALASLIDDPLRRWSSTARLETSP